MNKFRNVIFAFLFLSCTSNQVTEAPKIITTCKMFRTDSTKFALVTINVLDSLQAQEIKRLLHYLKAKSETVFDNYNPINDVQAVFITIDIENRFGGEINLGDLELSALRKGINIKLADYRLIATSKKLNNYYTYNRVDNGDRVTLIYKVGYIDVKESITDFEGEQGLKEYSKILREYYQNDEYSLLYEIIVAPNVEGFTDFSLSQKWRLIRQGDRYVTSL